MKKILTNIALGIPLTIILILSLIFVFIEGRLLISLDWIIYDNAFNGFIRYFFRLLFAILCIFVVILEFINMKKNNKTLTFYLIISNISLLISSFIIFLFGTNYVGIVVLGVAMFYTLIKGIKILISR